MYGTIGHSIYNGGKNMLLKLEKLSKCLAIRMYKSYGELLTHWLDRNGLINQEEKRPYEPEIPWVEYFLLEIPQERK